MKRVIGKHTVEYDRATDIVTVDGIYQASVLDIIIGEEYIDDFINDEDKRMLFIKLVIEKAFTITVHVHTRLGYADGYADIHVENDAYTVFNLDLEIIA